MQFLFTWTVRHFFLCVAWCCCWVDGFGRSRRHRDKYSTLLLDCLHSATPLRQATKWQYRLTLVGRPPPVGAGLTSVPSWRSYSASSRSIAAVGEATGSLMAADEAMIAPVISRVKDFILVLDRWSWWRWKGGDYYEMNQASALRVACVCCWMKCVDRSTSAEKESWERKRKGMYWIPTLSCSGEILKWMKIFCTIPTLGSGNGYWFWNWPRKGCR